MNSFILTGILVLLAADYLQILEEWTARGLTDTSYKVCMLLIGGPLCIAYGFKMDGSTNLSYLFLGVAICGSLMLLLKLRDFIHTRLKTLS